MQLAGSCYFALNRRTPPRGSPPALSRGSADPPLFHGPSISVAASLLSDGADPLSSADPLATAVDPSPPFRLRSADPLSSTDPLSLLLRTPPHHSVSVGADPLSSTDPLSLLLRTPPHHSVVRRRGLPSLSVAAAPSPPFRLRGADLLSSTDPLSLLPRPPPHHSVVRRRGPPLFHGPHLSGGADPLWPSPRTPSHRRSA
ncbi:hypothetical protein niasHT_009123 [Heterodera trifolii]|uniref:Uncharacterized protein n=1 Tax=Heterodera trifolii TaxID=157864 RepID=A0ABD2M4J0_9BILA